MKCYPKQELKCKLEWTFSYKLECKFIQCSFQFTFEVLFRLTFHFILCFEADAFPNTFRNNCTLTGGCARVSVQTCDVCFQLQPLNLCKTCVHSICSIVLKLSDFKFSIFTVFQDSYPPDFQMLQMFIFRCFTFSHVHLI